MRCVLFEHKIPSAIDHQQRSLVNSDVQIIGLDSE